MSHEQKPSPERSIDLLNDCISGLEIAVDMVSKAIAINSTYSYLDAEKGLDFKLHEESFMCARYIMEEIHKADQSEESKNEREDRKREFTPPEFVRKELRKYIQNMTVNRNNLETSISMHNALSQLNLDEEGFRYKFSIEDHLANLMAISDILSAHIKPTITKAFQARKSRRSRLIEEDKTKTASN